MPKTREQALEKALKALLDRLDHQNDSLAPVYRPLCEAARAALALPSKRKAGARAPRVVQ